MVDISTAKITIPKAPIGEIKRNNLIDLVLKSQNRVVYIHAGAGFGKTTLLSQLAYSRSNTIWITIDGESDVINLVNIVTRAVKKVFAEYEFSISECLLFEQNSNFISILANAFIASLEKLKYSFTIVMDDLHTIEEKRVKELIVNILKYSPDNIKFLLSSREAPFLELVPLSLRGEILEIKQENLIFSMDEANLFLDTEDVNIYNLTEGWPLAIRTFKLLLDSGVNVDDLATKGKDGLYSYLFYEYISQLPVDILEFLKNSACFDELEPLMLNATLGINNSKFILDSLVAQNIFTIKIDSRYYRYHNLFKNYLMELNELSFISSLQNDAANYYFNIKEYSKSADYAIKTKNKELIEKIILNFYKDKGLLNSYKVSALRSYFTELGDDLNTYNRELLVAKGAISSYFGDFIEANLCLDMAIPSISPNDGDLYLEAMVHKARVLRNFVSFEESNNLLDKLIDNLDRYSLENSYALVIEKIFNLCSISQITEAHDLTSCFIEKCAKEGNIKVKAWYERYLSVIYYLKGSMKESVHYYEESLKIADDERHFLSYHSVDMYVAKAFQMLGQRERAISVITEELKNLNNNGRYEELWLGYLFAAEIHYQDAFIDKLNGGNYSFDTTIKYFNLALEYAPLYRKTNYQIEWSKMQSSIYSLMFESSPKEGVIKNIISNLDNVNDHLKTIVLARLFGYFAAISDFPNAVKYAQLTIEIGEKANMMLLPTMAYGILARYHIATKNHENTYSVIKRFMQLCNENGAYEYFRMRKAYDPILQFSYDNEIEPEFTKQMIDFSGFKVKKVYIKTFGGFSVYKYKENTPIKMRTKKERELFAFILDAGSVGVTKEQIYEAIWYDSTSEDIKKLIGVNLAQLKKDLATLGVKNSILTHNKHYSMCRDEIIVDSDLFGEAVEEYNKSESKASLQKILSLYKGEYFGDFEAFWIVKKRVKYASFMKNILEQVKI